MRVRELMSSIWSAAETFGPDTHVVVRRPDGALVDIRSVEFADTDLGVGRMILVEEGVAP